ncbi:MAG TPA: T9SS type A sorting domain-containing protein, partial [Ferruginibacter sp.]|nr:T9SS type A sorting domain-containing protein [Ferruginibacter sp.]
GQSTASTGVGIFCADSSGGNYKNCIFWGNRAANNFFPGRYEFYSANDGSYPLKPRPTVSYSILQEPFPILNVTDSGNNSAAYPLFTDSVITAGTDGLYATADDGLRLQLCSPGIDAGLNIAIPSMITSDINGNPRILNNSVDLGAYENTSPVISGITTIANSGDSAFKSINGMLQVMTDCQLICTITSTGMAALHNGILAKIAIDPLMTTFNKPYVLRYYDINPSENVSTATAAITLYFLQPDFDAFNLAKGVYPSMPIDATDAANYKANIVVHQFHTVTGMEETLIPSSVIWNSTNSWWEVSFSVTGFSRFYLSTVVGPLPVRLEYFNGRRQDENILLNWKVNCFDSPFSTFLLERSGNGIIFDKIYSTQVSEERCLESFNYTDINPQTLKTYYRLKIIDADDKITYSKILFFGNSLKNDIMVSPALLKPGSLLNVVVQHKGFLLSIYNSNGHLIQKNKLAEGVNKVLVHTAAGVYFYRINNESNQEKKSGMIIIK